MAEDKMDIVQQNIILEKAVRRKWNKYTWSGLIIMLIGIILIVIGSLLNTGAYSAEGLLIGFGAIIVIAGLMRLLIGVINPATPKDLEPYNEVPVATEQVETEL